MRQCRGNVAGKWIIEFLLGLDVEYEFGKITVLPVWSVY